MCSGSAHYFEDIKHNQQEESNWSKQELWAISPTFLLQDSISCYICWQQMWKLGRDHKKVVLVLQQRDKKVKIKSGEHATEEKEPCQWVLLRYPPSFGFCLNWAESEFRKMTSLSRSFQETLKILQTSCRACSSDTSDPDRGSWGEQNNQHLVCTCISQCIWDK